MKRLLGIILLATSLLLGFAPTALAQENDLNGLSVEVVNTIEAPAFGFEGENPFGAQGPVQINATVEFAVCCDGFYDIDLSGDQISMRWIGDAQFARVIEEGTFDRYYFTFGEPILAGASNSANATLQPNITVLSPTELLVVISSGMEIGDGFDALIDVAVVGGDSSPSELAFTGASTWQLALVGATAIIGGAALVTASRHPRFATTNG